MKKKLCYIRIMAVIMVLSSMLPLFCAAEDEGAHEGTVVREYTLPNSDVEVLSKSALIYCADTDMYLYRKNESTLMQPASTVKILLGVIALEAYRDRMDEQVTVTRELVEGVTGLSIYLEAGEVVTISDLLHALIMYGANDAAYVLARLDGGTVNGMLAQLNERVRQIGCKNTVYKNITGLYADGAATTLYDIVTIARYAAGIEGYTDITSKDKYVIPATKYTQTRTVLSRNHLISKYRDTRYLTPGVTGMSFGSTEESGDCLVVSAKINGFSYYMAIMGGTTAAAENGEERQTAFEDAVTLLRHASEDFGFVEIVNTHMVICDVAVKFSTTTDLVNLVPADTVSLYLPKNVNIDEDFKYAPIVFRPSLPAPVSEGQEEGELVVYYLGAEICRVKLLAKSSVPQNKILYVLDEIEQITKTRMFLVSVAVFAVMLALYIIVSAAVHKRMKKRRKRLR